MALFGFSNFKYKFPANASEKRVKKGNKYAHPIYALLVIEIVAIILTIIFSFVASVYVFDSVANTFGAPIIDANNTQELDIYSDGVIPQVDIYSNGSTTPVS